ncbi:sugar transferase [Dechloromonas sp. TW-R-39-2]|uniref:sugar transferase n=1 Tax=Dechloromonas sp. TW-R-39-2 TaxID=2654218 RepID=UPI00193CC75C|nr:sugar transferase [Dechloromonas sp. TW-R-39-2]QRM20140.1 sugar transferase [Dechloromonas sp. TW-R-39-2]
MKRLFDFVLVSVAVIILLPLILLVALMIRLRLGSPVFFRQQRPGLHGKPFMLYKFRTMSNACDANGELLPDEIRLGGFGKTIRKLSLDELPQLWNVLVGDMSLVGPRPLLMQYLSRYSNHQARRHEVRPGITGWAQVNGRNAISWEKRFDLDVWYVDHHSFWLDLRILLITVKKVFVSSGVSATGHVTMPEFMGNTEKTP